MDGAIRPVKRPNLLVNHDRLSLPYMKEETSACRGLFFLFISIFNYGWLISNEFTFTVIGRTLRDEMLNPTKPLLKPYVVSVMVLTF